jgi:DNA-binding MarR family transcriptional regulator
LRDSVAATARNVGEEIGETFPMPSDQDSITTVLRGLTSLAERDVRHQFVTDVVRRAGVDLPPRSAWLLMQIDRHPELDRASLGRAQRVPREQVKAGLAVLEDRGIVSKSGDQDGPPRVTAAGREVLGRLVRVRRERLAEMFAEWAPERHERLAELVGQLMNELEVEPRAASREPKSRPGRSS